MAQDSINFTSNVYVKYLDEISNKTTHINEKLTSKANSALQRMYREELKLKAKLSRVDSSMAKDLFSNTITTYNLLAKRLNKDTAVLRSPDLSTYIPYLDSVKTTLAFLKQHFNGIGEGDLHKKLATAIISVNQLEAKLAQLNSIQKYIRERKAYLMQQLSKYGFAKNLKVLNKEVYYYGQLLREYKQILKDPKKIEEKALTVLRKVPSFDKFIKQNSQLAMIFGVPGERGNILPTSLVGVQTRASVQQQISSIAAINGTNAQPFISQQLALGNAQLSKLKNGIYGFDLDGNAIEVLDFKPNDQRHKPFLKRLEIGTNVQFGRTTKLLPTTGDFALSIGYKLNSSGIVGLGSSYKLGLGNGFRQIKLTHQGFGLRSYIDWKIKGSFYISGGYEKNYLPGLQSTLYSFSKWQESGLVGLTKKYPLRRKQGSLQILFDFLSYRNTPKTQPIIFRIGYIL